MRSDVMTVTQKADALVEQCCGLLASYPELRSVRIVLSGGVGYDRARGAVQIARAHRLRCWVSRQEIVFRVPDRCNGHPACGFAGRSPDGPVGAG
jgi:hypothetical protein